MYGAGIAPGIAAPVNVDLLNDPSITRQLVSNVELSRQLARAFGIGEPSGTIIVCRCNAGVARSLHVSRLVVFTLIASHWCRALIRNLVLRSFLIGLRRLWVRLIVG